MYMYNMMLVSFWTKYLCTIW